MSEHKRIPNRGLAIFRRAEAAVPPPTVQPIHIDSETKENLKAATQDDIAAIQNTIIGFYDTILGEVPTQQQVELTRYQTAHQPQNSIEGATFTVHPSETAVDVMMANTGLRIIHERVSMSLLGDLPSADIIRKVDQYRALADNGTIQPELLTSLVGREYASSLAILIQNNKFFAEEFWRKYAGARIVAGMQRYYAQEIDALQQEMGSSIMANSNVARESAQIVDRSTPVLRVAAAQREVIKYMLPPTAKESDKLPEELKAVEVTDPDERLALGLYKFASTFGDPSAQRLYSEYVALLKERNGDSTNDKADPKTLANRLQNKRVFVRRYLYNALYPVQEEAEEKGVFGRKKKKEQSKPVETDPYAHLTTQELAVLQNDKEALTAEVLTLRAKIQQHTSLRDENRATVDEKYYQYLEQLNTLEEMQKYYSRLLRDLRTGDEYTKKFLNFIHSELSEIQQLSAARAQAVAHEAVHQTEHIKVRIAKIAKTLSSNGFNQAVEDDEEKL